jgi:hypothetical protein
MSGPSFLCGGGVHDDGIEIARLRGADAVKNYGRGIGASPLLDQLSARAARPDFELLDGRGAESIRRAEKHGRAFLFQPVGELADGGCLANSVYPDHEDDAGRLRRLSIRRWRAGRENSQ